MKEALADDSMMVSPKVEQEDSSMMFPLEEEVNQQEEVEAAVEAEDPETSTKTSTTTGPRLETSKKVSGKNVFITPI